MQLRDQMAAAIASGALAPGERLPTLREMALDAGVDMNTVKRVYDDLQEHRLVVIHHGRGAFVADRLPEPTDHDTHASALAGLATHAIDMAEKLGFSATELAKAILERETKDSST
jgi:GntR family transcriptional regulator